MSPGWQWSVVQMASRVEKRMARALPVFRMERLARVMSTASESSVRDMLAALEDFVELDGDGHG